MVKNSWEAIVSVGIVLQNQTRDAHVSCAAREIILVRKRNTGLLALPAGKLDPGENHERAIRREILEETGLGPRDLELICGVPTVRVIEGNKVTLLGIVFEGYLKRPLPVEGRVVINPETDLVRPVGIEELRKMVRRKGKDLYMPEFNLPAIRGFVEKMTYDPYLR